MEELGSLVLARKPGESVVITLTDGTKIDIVINEVEGKTVRLKFTAPKTVVINRLEIEERKQQ